MDTRHYWEENGRAVKFENFNSNEGAYTVRGNGCSEQLNFATAPSEDEADFQQNGYTKKGKVSRQDPLSHRIIEKRRRDRMNNCLADLSRLIPTEYLKKGRGRVEKTEIIEMAIRHLKYLQDRVSNLNGRTTEADHYRAGFHEATSETLRYLVEVHGFGHGDGLCQQLSCHLQRHCGSMVKVDEAQQSSPEKNRNISPETTSSSASSTGTNGYAGKQAVMASADTQPASFRYMDYGETARDYTMECDGVSVLTTSNNPDDSEAPSGSGSEAATLNSRPKRNPDLRAVRKPDHNEDNFLHTYKFKNSIERRFSRSQDNEVDPKYKIKRVHDMSVRSTQTNGKVYTHKRRRAAKLSSSIPSTNTSNSGSTEDVQSTSASVSPQESTSSGSPHNHYEKPVLQKPQLVPVFALNAANKYYIPMNVDHSCLARLLGSFDVLDVRAFDENAPLHPVTINVNFQPCNNFHLKREDDEREWQP